jgi:hypothetical protein
VVQESNIQSAIPQAKRESGVVVTNRGALRRKYGGEVERIEAAIQAFVTSRRDAEIDLQTLAVDDETQLRPLAVRPVADPRDLSGNKDAIDAICRVLEPDYLIILGSVDIVPHQVIANPSSRCIETSVATDWTYGWLDAGSMGAANAPLMVGRIPGITGCQSVEPLLAALESATKTCHRRLADYLDPFVLCSASFLDSTRRTVSEVFGAVREINAVPAPRGVSWDDEQIGRPLHLINCHGSPQTPLFSGRATGGPTCPALLPEQLERRLSEGTIAAVTSCYGADLYAPIGGRERARYMPMCNAFLRNGAIGYFGSTGSSHGGHSELKEADRLVRDFLGMVLRGASLGAAARHAFVTLASSPSGLEAARARKNAWQFILLGDPTARLRNEKGGWGPVPLEDLT